MTEFRNEKLKIKMCDLGRESTAPTVFKTRNIQQVTKANLDPDDEVYVGYGFVEDVFPYNKNSMYTHEFKEQEIPCCVLENGFLKAVFLLTLGARLWSLFDKKENRELLLTNDNIGFCNFSARDAWFCGGIEWNFGIVGHNVYTCSQYHTAILKTDEGEPVLRFYEYERIRGCVFQMDFWLPENSDRLFAAMQIYNPNQYVTPTYWWTNMAIEELEDSRVIVPASEAYTYDTKECRAVKRKSLYYNGKDITYPTNHYDAVDHFWRTKNAARKFICAVDGDGYGICQASTDRLQGRKLFVFGQRSGSDNWQKRLGVCGKRHHYFEIQAGIAQTQYECLPMPPGANWKWLESFGAIKFEKEIAHGEYQKAVEYADQAVKNQNLEEIFKNATHIYQKADEILFTGSGWGALEREMRKGDRYEYPLPEHLDFGTVAEPQEPWMNLLKTGSIGNYGKNTVPVSWMNGGKCIERLKEAVKDADKENWYAWLQLGATALSENDFSSARDALNKSLALCENAWGCYVMACLEYKTYHNTEAEKWARKSVEGNRSEVSLIRENFKILDELQASKTVLSLYDILDDAAKTDGRVILYLADAYLKEKNYNKAKELFERFGKEMTVNIRESELIVTEMWIELQKGLFGEDAEITVPTEFEFRVQD